MSVSRVKKLKKTKMRNFSKIYKRMGGEYTYDDIFFSDGRRL